MTLAQSSRGSYRWLTITLLVAAGVYGWYASGQYGRLNALNQRQLSNAGAELKAALDTAVETATRFKRKRADWEKQASTSAKAAGDEPELCDFDQNQPYLDLDACASGGSPIPPGFSWSGSTAVQPFVVPTLGIKVTGGDGKTELPFRFRTDKLLRELAFPDSFGLIFIATDEGEVLYQDAPPRRRWLRHLRWGEQTFRDANADRLPALQIRNLRQVLGGSAERWNQLRSVTSRTSVQLGGTAHQLYLQPLVLDHGQRIGLVIGGAVPTKSIVGDALALDTQLVGVLVFLLLLGVLGYPFVKLACLAPCERLRLRDIKLIYLSTGALLVLMTCGSLALDGYARWHAVADEGLEALAVDLEGRFLEEVAAIRDELVDYDAGVSSLSIPDCSRWGVQTRWFDPDPEATRHHAATSVTETWLPWPNRNVHLRQVAWIGADGWQIWKITADTIPGKSRVNQRAYFRAAEDGNLFQIPGQEPAFFLGPDRSISDGKFYTFVSMPSKLSTARCAGLEHVAGRPVVAASAHLLSLDRQPLPAGYGFALVNREGRVLYHSDGRLSLREDFYEELSESGRARAMAYAGLGGELESAYRERPHTFYFQPIRLVRAGERSPAGFYLAVFRDTSVERALVGHVFVVGLVVPMVVLVGIYAVGLWVLQRFSRHSAHGWSAWLWPHGGLDHIYKRQAAAFVVLLLASAAVYMRFENPVVFLLTPTLAAALGIGIYAHGSRHKPARRRLCAPAWQTSALLLVLVCMVITPSAALFRVTLSHEFAKLILTERQWIAAQRSDTLRAAAVEALADDYAPARTTQLTKAREEYFGCVPAPFDAAGLDLLEPEVPETRNTEVVRTAQTGIGPQRSVTTPERGASFVGCVSTLDDSAGSYPTNAATLQPIGADVGVIDALLSLDNVWAIDNETLTRQRFQPRRFAYSPDGTFLRPLRASGIAFLGFALTLGLLVWWIRWNTNRLFLADEETSVATASPSAPVEELWAQRTPDEQMVLLQIARERIANPYQRGIITDLLRKGLLCMDPDLRPCSDEFDAFLRKKELELRAEIRDWEQVKGGHSWHYGRLILIVSMSALGFFLIATQPGLQSSLLGIASVITGALTAVLKLREAVTSWFPGRKSAA